MKALFALCAAALLLSGVAPVLARDSARPTITPENGAQVVEKIRLGRGSAEHVAFSPDGQTIAVASSVGVWLYAASALDTPSEPPLVQTSGAAEALAFSPDGSLLAVASDGEIVYWDVASQQESGRFEIKTDSSAIAFSPDGTLLAINLGSYGISLWDVKGAAEKANLKGSIQRDGAIAFSPDGALLAGSTSDYAVHLWNVADGSEAAALSGHKSYVYDVAFSPEGKLLASASYDKTIHLWDVTAGSELAVLAGTDEQPLEQAYAVAFSPDGALLVSGHAEGGVALWDVAGKTLKGINPLMGDVLDVAFSPDGKQFATASSLPAVQLWDTASGTAGAVTVGHTEYMSTAVFSPDSKTLALTDWAKNIWLWDTASMQELNGVTPLAGEVSSGTQNVTDVTYSPDGSLLATSNGFDVILLDASTHAEATRLDDCVGTAESLVFSPDSLLLAIGSSDGLCLFDVKTGDMLASFHTNDWANGVAFSPDQTLIAVASKDHTVRVYGLP